jgi:hypothetical protein
MESDHPADFLDRDVRQIAYPAVTPRKLQSVLIKLVTFYNSADAQTLAQIDRKRRAEVENVLKSISARGG